MMDIAKNLSQDILDPLDLRLIAELEIDAKQNYAALAAKLGTTRMTVNRRLQRLLDKRLITLTTVADPISLGYKTEAAILINVQPGKVLDVGNELAALENVKFVFLTAGHYDIIAWIITRDHEDLLAFYPKALANIQAITNAEILVSLKRVKAVWRLFGTEELFPVKGNTNNTLDELDLMLIRELESEPRASTNNLANKIGTSPSSVARRLHALRRDGIIKVVSVARPAALGYRIRTVIMLKVKPDKVTVVADRLSQYPNIMHMNITAGRFDIYAWTLFSDGRHMADFLIDELGAYHSEITYYETVTILRAPKVLFTVLAPNAIHQL